MNINNWWKAHGGAVVGFAGAAGVLLTSIAPELAAQTSPYLQEVSTVVGIVGAVLHAYRGTTAKE